jgi:hypothetical protein
MKRTQAEVPRSARIQNGCAPPPPPPDLLGAEPLDEELLLELDDEDELLELLVEDEELDELEDELLELDDDEEEEELDELELLFGVAEASLDSALVPAVFTAATL